MGHRAGPLPARPLSRQAQLDVQLEEEQASLEAPPRKQASLGKLRCIPTAVHTWSSSSARRMASRVMPPPLVLPSRLRLRVGGRRQVARE